jgi:chemotaxis methyl-accepting protein methylase
LCSNVLIYYRPDICQAILSKLHQCLNPDGCLLTGEAERGIVQKSAGFRAIAPPVSVFQKFRRA